MSENKTVRVYLVTGAATGTESRNYIRAIRHNQLLFGPKEKAKTFTPKQANILQKVLTNTFGNGHIESE